MKAIEVKEGDVIGSNGELVVLDFWAPWCGPCKMLGPIIDEIADDYEEDESVVIGKVNVDNESDLGFKHNVKSIPCIIFLKDGVQVEKIIGNRPKKNFTDIIERLK